MAFSDTYRTIILQISKSKRLTSTGFLKKNRGLTEGNGFF